MEQSLCHFSLLLMLEMRVIAGDSQTRISDLISNEVAGRHVMWVPVRPPTESRDQLILPMILR